MKEYHKIETLFKFDGEKKRHIPGDFYNETVEYLKDFKWIFTEKVDGTNFRIHWDGHELSYGGRTSKSQFSTNQIKFITEELLTEDLEILIEQKFKEKPITIYGELYGKDIQKVGSSYSSEYEFKVFDILIPIMGKPISEKFVSREVLEFIVKDLGLDIVPVVLEGTIDEGLSYIKNNNKSTFSEAPLEGIVGVPKGNILDGNGTRIIVKLKKRDLEK